MAAVVTNAAALELIKDAEGLRLVAYQDPSGAWTIGYGHTVGVIGGEQITAAQADALLAQDLAMFERGVDALAKDPSENEFSAMVSLAFNIGLGAFAGSTVLRQHNAGDKPAAADAFRLWNKAHVDGQLVELPGLVARREAERKIYLTPDAAPVPPPTETVLYSGTLAAGEPFEIVMRVGNAAIIDTKPPPASPSSSTMRASALGLLMALACGLAGSAPAAPIPPQLLVEEAKAPAPLLDAAAFEAPAPGPNWRFGQGELGRLTIEYRQPDGSWLVSRP
jgi:lysozyme